MNEEKNNFKALEENVRVPDGLEFKVEKRTQGNLGLVRMLFNVVDLYVSKFFDVLVHATKDETLSVGEKNGFALGNSPEHADDENENPEKEDKKDDE